MTQGTTQGEELCEHISSEVIEWMRSLGFKYTNDMGHGMSFNHKMFVKGSTIVFADNAQFFYQELTKARLEELEMVKLHSNNHNGVWLQGGIRGNYVQERIAALTTQLKKGEQYEQN